MNIFNETIWSIPNRIKKDIVVFSMPLFLLSASRSEHSFSLYWTALIGAFFGLIPLTSKHKMICSSILYLVQLFSPDFYYFTLGFALVQAYDNNILLTKKSEINLFISRLEIVGWLCSEIMIIPKIIQIILGSILFFVSITCKSPCIECEDPFEEMKKRIESSGLLNLEYRHFVKNENTLNSSLFESLYISLINNLQPFLFEILYMVSRNKILILFCSFFSYEISEYIIFLIGIMAIMDLRWELITLLVKGSASGNIPFRILTTFLMVTLTNILQSLFKDNVETSKS